MEERGASYSNINSASGLGLNVNDENYYAAGALLQISEKKENHVN
jgi:hypothetical protein